MSKLNLCVDGHEFENEESDFLGDGAFPPFMIFDIEGQTYLPGEYASREKANTVMQAIIDNCEG